MQTTQDLLDAVKAKAGINSDYSLAKTLNVTRASISRYRNGKDTMGDEIAMRVAGILNIPPAYVFAIAHSERASDEGARVVWQELAKKLHHAAPIMAGVMVIAGLTKAGYSAVYILCKIAALVKTRYTPFLMPA